MNTDSIRKTYRSTTAFVSSALVIFIALNLVVGYAPYIWYIFRSSNPVAEKYGEAPLLKVYPEKSHQEIHDLLVETHSKRFVYESFTQFAEPPYSGKYVNIDENGFRLSANQTPWPPSPAAFDVFIFGGSTTFGYGVSDAETVASYLQNELREIAGASVSVYNFGRGFYYSSQERALFEKVLLEGHIPKMAIFIDGLNEFNYERDAPQFTRRLEKIFATATWKKGDLRSFISRLPVVLAMKRLVARSRPSSLGGSRKSVTGSSQRVNKVIERYLANKKIIEAIAAIYKVKPIFVWQPVPTYKYDQKSHLFAGLGYPNEIDLIQGYPAMEMRNVEKRLGANFLWCADVQEGVKKPLYVDAVHYTAGFSRTVAECIAALLKGRGLLRPE